MPQAAIKGKGALTRDHCAAQQKGIQIRNKKANIPCSIFKPQGTPHEISKADGVTHRIQGMAWITARRHLAIATHRKSIPNPIGPQATQKRIQVSRGSKSVTSIGLRTKNPIARIQPSRQCDVLVIPMNCRPRRVNQDLQTTRVIRRLDQPRRLCAHNRFRSTLTRRRGACRFRPCRTSEQKEDWVASEATGEEAINSASSTAEGTTGRDTPLSVVHATDSEES